MEFFDELFDGGGRQRIRQQKSLMIKKLVSIGFQRTKASERAQNATIQGLFELHSCIHQWFNVTPKSYSFRRRLVITGFKSTKADLLAHVTRPIASHYSVLQRLDIALEYVLGKYKPIYPPNHSFPFHEDTEEVWNDHKVPKCAEFKIINIPHNRTQTRIVSELLDQIAPQDTLYFHATSWRSCDSITTHGVKHAKGRPCLDFGSLPSFYVTPHLKTALDWANKTKRMFADETCVLVFSGVAPPRGATSNKHTNPFHGLNVKVFDSANKEWADSVKESRMCAKEVHQLDTYDIVRGPMLANPSSVLSSNAIAVAHNPPKHQVAVKSDKADEVMTQHLVACVYLRK